jgi:hypothetical protein
MFSLSMMATRSARALARIAKHTGLTAEDL